MRQRAILETHAWQRPVLGGVPLSPEEAGSIQSIQFDSQGELLIAASEDGLLSVHSTAALLAACQPLTHAADGDDAGSRGGSSMASTQHHAVQQQVVGTAEPLLLLDCHMPKLQAVRWNPADENVVGVVSAATRQLHLFDLQHTQVRHGCGGDVVGRQRMVL